MADSKDTENAAATDTGGEEQSDGDIQVHTVERIDHMAVRIADHIVVLGGANMKKRLVPFDNIRLFDLKQNRWRRCVCSRDNGGRVPRARVFASAVLLRTNIYLFGGSSIVDTEEVIGNDLWPLTFNDDFTRCKWDEVKFAEEAYVPTPQLGHCAWPYDDKMWVFGGLVQVGNDVEHPINDMFSYDPKMSQWKEIKCSGSIPSPRVWPSVALIQKKAFMFGGYHELDIYEDLYELDMEQMIWTKIITCGPSKPGKIYDRSFIATSDDEIILYCGYMDKVRVEYVRRCWVLHVSDRRWELLKEETDYTRSKFVAVTDKKNRLVIVAGMKYDKTYKYMTAIMQRFKIFPFKEDTPSPQDSYTKREEQLEVKS